MGLNRNRQRFMFDRRVFVAGSASLAAAAPWNLTSGQDATPSEGTPAAATAVSALGYPEQEKTITFIVPWGAGGGSDISARALAEVLEPELGTTISVVNQPGGGSLVGLTEFVGAEPDGYTIAMTNLPATISVYSNPELGEPQWTRDDLEPVALHVLDPAAVAVAVDSEYQSLTDLIAAASDAPGEVSLSSSGPLSVGHLAILLLQQQAEARFATTFFDDAGQQRAATLGGHVNAEVGTLGELVPAANSGELRVLAVFSAERSEFLPDAQTAVEQGFDVEFASARGISVPAGTPQEIIDALEQAIERAMQNPEHQADMEGLGLPLHYMDAEEFGEYWSTVEERVVPLIEEFVESQ